jgi:transcriptional regulatory protein LevR
MSKISHHAECTGIMGGIRQFHHLLDEWKCNSGIVTVLCDNISDLRHSLDVRRYPNISKQMNFDITQSIKNDLPQSVTYKWQHVKGHQGLNFSHLT